MAVGVYVCSIGSFSLPLSSILSLLHFSLYLLLSLFLYNLCFYKKSFQECFFSFFSQYTNIQPYFSVLDLGSEMDIIETEQYIEENDYIREDKPSQENWKSISDTGVDSDDSPSSGFDCNICLDSVQEPVVTLCGHLYCWPCIYKWLHFQSISTENYDLEPQQQCPVCKAEVSEGTLVPLFGRGQTAKPSKSKAPNLGVIIPRRPLGLACEFDSPRSPFATSITARPTQQMYHGNYPHQSQLYYSRPESYSASPMFTPRVAAASMFDPVIGMFGEMIYARVFGNSITNIYSYPNSYNLAGNTSPRLRRHVMQADKSLSRICFFLFCCVFLCFLSF